MKTKKLLALFVLFVMGCVILAGCAKTTDEAKIQATIQKYFDAQKEKEISRLESTLDANFMYEDMDKTEYLATLTLALMFSDITDIKIVFDSVNVTGNVAIAKCTVTVTASIMGFTETTTSQQEFTMSKASGDWLIKGLKTEEIL